MLLEKYLSYLTERQGLEVYDKAKWHTEKGGTYNHILIMIQFLKKKRCFNRYGLELYGGKHIDDGEDTSINSEMLNPKCQKVMKKCYDKWLKNINYKKNPDIKPFEKCARGL